MRLSFNSAAVYTPNKVSYTHYIESVHFHELKSSMHRSFVSRHGVKEWCECQKNIFMKYDSQSSPVWFTNFSPSTIIIKSYILGGGHCIHAIFHCNQALCFGNMAGAMTSIWKCLEAILIQNSHLILEWNQPKCSDEDVLNTKSHRWLLC